MPIKDDPHSLTPSPETVNGVSEDDVEGEYGSSYKMRTLLRTFKSGSKCGDRYNSLSELIALGRIELLNGDVVVKVSDDLRGFAGSIIFKTIIQSRNDDMLSDGNKEEPDYQIWDKLPLIEDRYPWPTVVIEQGRDGESENDLVQSLLSGAKEKENEYASHQFSLHVICGRKKKKGSGPLHIAVQSPMISSTTSSDCMATIRRQEQEMTKWVDDTLCTLVNQCEITESQHDPEQNIEIAPKFLYRQRHEDGTNEDRLTENAPVISAADLWEDLE
ncbi:hypothetical protein DFS33DRAFT_1270418 [Desarmillaria ectypa]|nr:hypothetical protein DFS33DRAFT_1270418 [Desarmillaria ectypa]